MQFNNFPVGYGNAYGIFPNGPGFYSLPGYTQYAYPFGVPNTPYPEIYLHSRSDNAYGACPNVVTHPSQAEVLQVHQVLPGQQQTIDFHTRPEEEKRQATERPIVQFCDGATPENTVAQPDSGARQNSMIVEAAIHPTPEGRTIELEDNGTVYHTAQTRREDSSCTREPLTKTELRTKKRKVLSYEGEEDSTDEDVRETQL